MAQINIETIKIIIDNFINKIKETNETHFYFKNELYWSVPEENLTDMSQQPELQVGSISDDINFLNRTVEEEFDANFLELERLSAIFKFLSIRLTTENNI